MFCATRGNMNINEIATFLTHALMTDWKMPIIDREGGEALFTIDPSWLASEEVFVKRLTKEAPESYLAHSNALAVHAHQRAAKADEARHTLLPLFNEMFKEGDLLKQRAIATHIMNQKTLEDAFTTEDLITLKHMLIRL